MRIPSVARGFSREPIDAPLTLPAELLGPDSWVIVGGESGIAAPSHPFALEWARQLRDQCARTRTAFFMKQLGACATQAGVRFKTKDRHGGDWSEWPEDLRVRQFPAAFCLASPQAGEGGSEVAA